MSQDSEIRVPSTPALAFASVGPFVTPNAVDTIIKDLNVPLGIYNYTANNPYLLSDIKKTITRDLRINGCNRIDRRVDVEINISRSLSSNYDCAIGDFTKAKAQDSLPGYYRSKHISQVARLPEDYHGDCGGAIIGGIPLSHYNAFLTAETSIDILGAISNRTIDIPGREGLLFLGYTEDQPRGALVIHLYDDSNDSMVNRQDNVDRQVQELLDLLDPTKGPIDMILEEAPAYCFYIIQTGDASVSLINVDATVTIPILLYKTDPTSLLTSSS